jgi:predicted Fe-Mo cluster-binding NifX family protein
MLRPGHCLALATLLVLPWPAVAVDWRRQLDTSLVAVPSTGPTLDAPVSAVFSRGRYFQIVDFNTGEVVSVANPYRRELHAVGLRTAFLLLERRVGIVVARHIGPEPFGNLAGRGVLLFTTGPATVLEALVRLRKGLLVRARRPDVGIHHGLERRGVKLPPPPAGACPFAAPPAAPTGAGGPTRLSF